MNNRFTITVERENMEPVKTECDAFIGCCTEKENKNDDKSFSMKANVLMFGRMSRSKVLAVLLNMSLDVIRSVSMGDTITQLAFLTSMSGSISDEVIKLTKQMYEEKSNNGGMAQ